MDHIPPGFWLSLAQWLWIIGLTIFAAVRKPGEEAGRSLQTLREQIATQNQMNAVELASLRNRGDLFDERLRHLPTHTDMRTMIEQMSRVQGEVQSVREAQSRQQTVLQRIEDWLMAQERGGAKG